MAGVPRVRENGFFVSRDMSGITGILAEGGISVFAISTYDTDYVLVKEDEFEKALRMLNNAG